MRVVTPRALLARSRVAVLFLMAIATEVTTLRRHAPPTSRAPVAHCCVAETPQPRVGVRALTTLISDTVNVETRMLYHVGACVRSGGELQSVKVTNQYLSVASAASTRRRSVLMTVDQVKYFIYKKLLIRDLENRFL